MTLSCDDVCKLLEACSKFDVAELNLGNFSLKMKGAASSYISQVPSAITVSEKVTQAADEIARKTDEAKNVDDMEEEDLKLVVEDPYEWEQRTLSKMRGENQ